jgi:lipopolysaccharide transport system ATP-binding protein
MSSEASFRGLSPNPVQASEAIAIRVRDVSKCYQIYDRPEDRLKQSLLPRLQRLLGRPESRYYREFWALRDVSFDVHKGETLGVIGRNGSGKSTLLQIICGTRTPTGGDVEVVGRLAALLELGSGFNPEFTGRENIYMSGAVLGLSRAKISSPLLKSGTSSDSRSNPIRAACTYDWRSQ